MEGALMRRNARRNANRLIGLAGVLLAWSGVANASPTFTLTDLNGVADAAFPRYVVDSHGNTFVTMDNQTAYPFVQTPAVQPPSTSGLPAFNPMPPLLSNQLTDNISLYALENTNRIAVANGVTAIETWNGSTFFGSQPYLQYTYYAQQNPDGSWGTPKLMWSGSMTQYVLNYGQFGNTIMAINKQNEVVGVMQTGTGSGATDSGVLYDINTKTLTNLSALPSVVQAGLIGLVPFAIDDDGRILASVVKSMPGGWEYQDTILLTPDGVTSDPVLMPVPEPSSLAVLLAATGFYGCFHMRRRAKRAPASQLLKFTV
jgi:hypothetical protein